MTKIQSGDKVKVITGKYKGTIGRVIKVYTTKKKQGILKRVAVSGVPKIVKYRKAVRYNNELYPGQKFEVDRKLDISNVSLLLDDKTISKVGFKVIDGKKQRVFKKNDKIVAKSTSEKEESKKPKKKSTK